VRWTKERSGITDSGYTGIMRLQRNSRLPKKSSKNKPLTKEEKKQNQEISSERVVNENVIGSLKRFKIISDRYRNRRKRFGIRFNLIAGIHNLEIKI
jgi:DDE superfamily endonuclease